MVAARRDYAANVEQAEAVAPRDRARPAPAEAMQKVPTPEPVDLRGGCRSCSACRWPARVKCLLIHAAATSVQMLLVRGDHMGNEVKIGKLPGLGPWRWASEAEIVAATGCRAGLPRPGRHPAGTCRSSSIAAWR